MQAFIFKLLGYLPGVLTDEVDVPTLLATVAEAELDAPAGAGRLAAAVLAIEAKAGAIFRRDDWFKALALELLSHVAQGPQPAPIPAPKDN